MGGTQPPLGPTGLPPPPPAGESGVCAHQVGDRESAPAGSADAAPGDPSVATCLCQVRAGRGVESQLRLPCCSQDGGGGGRFFLWCLAEIEGGLVEKGLGLVRPPSPGPLLLGEGRGRLSCSFSCLSLLAAPDWRSLQGPGQDLWAAIRNVRQDGSWPPFFSLLLFFL